jgi:uncharacterized protein YecT (DUF1311 family)
MILPILPILLAAAVAAQQQPNCKDPETQSDMNICSARDFRAADAAMSRQYDVVVARMKQMDTSSGGTYDDRPSYFAALLESQRAWLKFRDSYCVVEGYYARGGTMEPLLVNTCLEQVTKQRTDQLLELYKIYSE